MKKEITNETDMEVFGAQLARHLRGGELIELVGDVGAGKTTLTRAIARGMGVQGPIQSPTFTISNRYTAPSGLELVHYDFYRLGEAGIMSDELAEVITGERTVTIIEWAEIVTDVLDQDKLTVHIETVSETARNVTLEAGGNKSNRLLGGIV